MAKDLTVRQVRVLIYEGPASWVKATIESTNRWVYGQKIGQQYTWRTWVVLLAFLIAVTGLLLNFFIFNFRGVERVKHNRTEVPTAFRSLNIMVSHSENQPSFLPHAFESKDRWIESSLILWEDDASWLRRRVRMLFASLTLGKRIGNSSAPLIDIATKVFGESMNTASWRFPYVLGFERYLPLVWLNLFNRYGFCGDLEPRTNLQSQELAGIFVSLPCSNPNKSREIGLCLHLAPHFVGVGSIQASYYEQAEGYKRCDCLRKELINLTSFCALLLGFLCFGWGWGWWKSVYNYPDWVTEIWATVGCIIGCVFWVAGFLGLFYGSFVT